MVLKRKLFALNFGSEFLLMGMGQFHRKHSFKRNRKEDCQYVYGEVLYISAFGSQVPF